MGRLAGGEERLAGAEPVTTGLVGAVEPLAGRVDDRDAAEVVGRLLDPMPSGQ